MKVSELLNNIGENSDYIFNSLYLKSSDIYGCTYKYLVKTGSYASRKQIFIALNSEESELDLLEKTVVDSIEVYPAQ